MSSTRRLSLAVEDPLAPRTEATPNGVVARSAPKTSPRPAKEPAKEPSEPPQAAVAQPEPGPSAAQSAEEGLWRTWSGTSRPASYRLADDLLDELDKRTHSLRLPVGLTVTAALLQLLDQDDGQITRLVDRVEEAHERARRAARRRRASPSE